MLFYVVTREHAYAMEAYAQGWDGLRLLFYDDLFHAASLPTGAYVFTDHDRLTDSERRLTAAVWDQLAAHFPHVRLLNDPQRVLGRYKLLRVASALSNPVTRHFRRAAQLLRGY